MQISARKHLMSTARALLFIGMLFLSFFALAHALTIESISIVRANSADQSTLTPGSATITANGTSTQVLTVTVKDTNGNNVISGGADIAITQSSGTGLIGSVTDNGNGTYSATVTSPTTIGNGVFVATLAGAPVKGGTSSQTQAIVSYIAGVATKGVLITQPGVAVNGVALTTQPVVQLQDANGNNVSASNVDVVATITSGTGTLGGTTTVKTNTSGVATFSNLSISGTAGNFVLTFTPTSLLAATSNLFSLTAGAASQIAVNAGDAQSAVAGSAVAIAPSVIIKDANNNPVSGVSVTFANGTGGSVSGTMTATTGSDGIATFAGTWTLGNTAGSNTLTATNTGLSGSPVTFTATGTAGVATKGVLITQPGVAVNGVALTTQPVVQLQDANGNNVSASNVDVVATITSGTGTLGGTTTVKTNTSGVATFSNLSISGTAGNFVLTFTPTSLAAATSNPFSLTAGTASKLAFTTQPSASTVSGAAFAQQPVVTIQDAAGNTVTDATNSITLSLTTGEGLGGTLKMNAVNGVADFIGKGVNINEAGEDKVLSASATGLTSATTTPAFTITLPVVNIAAIPGVTPPVKGAIPVRAITATDQYTGIVIWNTVPGSICGPFTAYTATIILFPKPGFTLAGVAANFFTVAGATPVTNLINSGEVTAVFPATAEVRIGENFWGGKVFYILQPGDTGYHPGQTHGLIAAIADQSDGISWWNGSSTTTGATRTAIGTGAANTVDIIVSQGSGSYAAKLCDDYSVTVDGVLYHDWYLPSKDELMELYNQRAFFPGFADVSYWSSSESSANFAWYQYFGDGNQYYFDKYYGYFRVRAVRAF